MVSTMAQGSTNGSQPALTNVLQVDTTQKARVGTLAHFEDEVYGEIEAIYLPGVASLGQFDAVIYDEVHALTARAITTGSLRGPVAIALSNPTAVQWGWFLVKGQCPVNTSGTGGAQTGLALTSTAGQLGASGGAAGDVLGAGTTAAQGTVKAGNVTGYTDCTFDRPSVRP
jgi:hypothetical protein